MQVNPSAFFPESITNPATYTSITTISDSDKVSAAKTYLNDPVLLSQLTERVYELLLTDLKYQQERVRSYSRRI
ncbi:MAG TPA: hypothetical protein V6D09_05230 [Leptolyngbyaceae cyanobacterium]